MHKFGPTKTVEQNDFCDTDKPWKIFVLVAQLMQLNVKVIVRVSGRSIIFLINMPNLFLETHSVGQWNMILCSI